MEKLSINPPDDSGGVNQRRRTGVYGLMMQQPLSISTLLEFAEKFHPNVEIVTRTVEGPIQRGNWRELAGRARRLANALVALGVRPGDRVATVAWNTQRHLELYFAVSGMGAVLHTINPRLSAEQMRYVIEHAEDKLLFFDTTFAPMAARIQAECATIKTLVALRDAVAPADDGWRSYEALLADASEDFAWPALDESAAASLCYTSGTTGNPKGVVYSHRSTLLHSYAACMADTLGISATDVTLPVVPMFHVNAWGVPYAAAMVGSKLVFPGPALDGASVLDLILSERVTSLLGVPTVWQNLLNVADQRGVRLSAVKKVTIGGSAVPASMIERFEKQHGARVIHAWGMTETSPVGTVNVLLPKHGELDDAGKLAIKLKQGRPVFGVDLRLLDDDGRPLPFDGQTSGHLQVRGPWVASSYFKHDGDGAAHRDGWFSTGDVGTIDPDGYLQITDRSKDVIKSGGEWISSIALENEAMGHAAVAQAAVIGLPHPKWQERPLLVVVRAAGATLEGQELIAWLAARVPKWWLPDAVEFIDALPLGATGKVLKRALRDRFKDYVLPGV
jgi:fatty-acyl-CoA synthase